MTQRTALTNPLPPPREAARQRTRVLAVDDDPQILWYVRHTLSQAGYTTIVTGDPGEVERLIKVEKPHLILLDLALPGANGFELMKRIPDITDAPVMFLSGHATDQDISRGLEIGAADYVVKPFSPNELVARIKAALRKGAPSDRTEPREPCAGGPDNQLRRTPRDGGREFGKSERDRVQAAPPSPTFRRSTGDCWARAVR